MKLQGQTQNQSHHKLTYINELEICTGTRYLFITQILFIFHSKSQVTILGISTTGIILLLRWKSKCHVKTNGCFSTWKRLCLTTV